MDPLLAARSRRMRGRIRFQKDLDVEIAKVKKTRERLEAAIGDCITELKVTKMAKTSRQTEYNVYACIYACIADIAWFKAGENAQAEVYADVRKQITKRLIKLFATRRGEYSL